LSPGGVISGMPTAAGGTFRVRVTDASGHTAVQDLCILVDEASEGTLSVDRFGTSGLTLQQIGDTLAGDGVSISNVTYSGTTGRDAAVGTFTGGFSATGINSGVILSSGRVKNVIGPNNSDEATFIGVAGGDADLATTVGGTILDAAVLQFDFTVTDPHAEVATFQYVFASEEYNEYANTQFNDVFGFFMSGPGFPNANLALIPGTTTPVSINTVNGGNRQNQTPPQHPEFFVNNDLNDGGTQPLLTLIQADGLTRVLTVQASVAPGATYHLKLAIGDVSDRSYDSWVLIKGGSLSAACTLIPPPAFID